jgi:hypothetical protein
MEVGRHKRNGYTGSAAGWSAPRISGIRSNFGIDLQVVIAASTVSLRTLCRCILNDVASHNADEREMEKVRHYSVILGIGFLAIAAVSLPTVNIRPWSFPS